MRKNRKRLSKMLAKKEIRVYNIGIVSQEMTFLVGESKKIF